MTPDTLRGEDNLVKQTLEFDQAQLDDVLTAAEGVFLENGIVEDFVPQVADASRGAFRDHRVAVFPAAGSSGGHAEP
jgi:hypothetical protein